MRDLIKWGLKVTLNGAIWVLVLSIRIDGRPLFSYASEALTQNSFVASMDEELANLWETFVETSRITYARIAGGEESSGADRSAPF